MRISAKIAVAMVLVAIGVAGCGVRGPLEPPPAAAAEPAGGVDAASPSDWNGSHTVTPRDSLYVLSKQYKVKVADLQSVNNIADPSKLRAGTVLKVPGGGGSGNRQR